MGTQNSGFSPFTEGASGWGPGPAGMAQGIYGEDLGMPGMPGGQSNSGGLLALLAGAVPEYRDPNEDERKAIFRRAMLAAGAAMLSAPIGEFSKGLGDAGAAFMGTREGLTNNLQDRLDKRSESTARGEYNKGMLDYYGKIAEAKNAPKADPQALMSKMLIEDGKYTEEEINAADKETKRAWFKSSSTYRVLSDHLDSLVEAKEIPIASGNAARAALNAGELEGARDLISGKASPGDYDFMDSESESHLPGFTNVMNDPETGEQVRVKIHKRVQGKELAGDDVGKLDPSFEYLLVSYEDEPTMRKWVKVSASGDVSEIGEIMGMETPMEEALRALSASFGSDIK